MAYRPYYDQTREPLEVFAIDEGMNRATGSIPYKSLRWVRRYCEPGEFEMVVPANIYSPTWAYVYTDSRPEMGIIQKVEYQDDSQVYGGIDSVTVSGFFFERVLNNIVFLVESPEEQKVYVPEPRRPFFQHSRQDQKVYTDASGTYYYQNAQGTITNASTGQSGLTTDGLTEVDYKAAYGSAYSNPDMGLTSKDYYYTDSGRDQITTVPYHGPDYGDPDQTYDIEFEDDKGNVFYVNEYGTLTQAVGVVEKYQDTYQAQKRKWNALDGDEYGHYYTVTVKGPWQRTEALEPVTEGDSIDIVFKWAQRMMGNWILYEEPAIEGIQKAVDPSFQYLGDLMYSTLYEVGASLRLEYLFDENTFILSAYRGADRTQIEGAEEIPGGDDEVIATALMVPVAAEIHSIGTPPILPSGYTELEYIEGSGIQYIDTGYKPNQDTRVVISIEPTTGNSVNAVFGARTETSNGSFCIWYIDGYYRTDYDSADYVTTETAASGRVTIDKDKGTTTIGDENHIQVGSPFVSANTLTLFAVNGAGNGGATLDPRMFHGRIFSCQIYDNGTLVRVYVPAKRSSDGAVGMYDTMSDQFYDNDGSGSFVAGPVIDRQTYTELEYIQSNGSQVIQTSFIANQSSRVVADYSLTALSNSPTMIFGSRDQSSSYSRNFSFFKINSSDLRSDYGNNQQVRWAGADTGRHTVDKRGGTTYFDDVSRGTSSAAPFTTATGLTIFGEIEDGTEPVYLSTMKLYSLDFYQDGSTLTASLIPVRRDSDGEAGMYDTVSGTFYGNVGDGSFSAGPEVKQPAKLTYYPNSTTATGITEPQEGYVGDSVQVRANGYLDESKSFTGWATGPNGGTWYQPGSSFTLTGMDDALYAQWEEDEPEPPGPGPDPSSDKAPWAVFSDTWGTINGYDSIEDTSNYKNTCYVLYEYDVPSSFDENGWPEAGPITAGSEYLGIPARYGIEYTRKRGYNTERIGDEDEPAIETYLDLRSEKPTCDSDWSRDWVDLPTSSINENQQAQKEAAKRFAPPEDAYDMRAVYEAYESDLQGRGEAYLRENYGVETTLDTGTVNTRDYLKGWDLGDLVEFEVSTVGLASQARITEVEEVYESGSVTINITVGDRKLLRLRKRGGA